jgi:hypothetical protein
MTAIRYPVRRILTAHSWVLTSALNSRHAPPHLWHPSFRQIHLLQVAGTEKGFLHLDVEEDGVLDRHGLAAAWNTLFDKGRAAAPFIDALDRCRRPVVIDWGFPPECLDAVRKLFDGGVMLWWFAADWAVARRKFAERGNRKGTIDAFDVQIRKIEAALPDINALFGSHVVYALPSTGIYTLPETIWKGMLDTLVESARRHLGAPPIPHPHPNP